MVDGPGCSCITSGEIKRSGEGGVGGERRGGRRGWAAEPRSRPRLVPVERGTCERGITWPGMQVELCVGTLQLHEFIYDDCAMESGFQRALVSFGVLLSGQLRASEVSVELA